MKALLLLVALLALGSQVQAQTQSPQQVLAAMDQCRERVISLLSFSDKMKMKAAVVSILPVSVQTSSRDAARLPVVISGGHETDPRDHGRPVVLVAGGLGVSPEVFRDAFSRVHPVAAGSYPEQERAQQNKAVLLSALANYGITNQKLDAVSDVYRYNPGSGHLWPTKPAVLIALVESGVVISYQVVDGGAGYSSQPVLSVPGARSGHASVNLSFCQDLSKNGSIASVTLLK